MSQAKTIVTLPKLVKVAKDALLSAKLDIPIIVVKTNGELTPEGTAVFDEIVEDIHIDKSCLKEVKRSVNDVCFLPFSSGTTGLVKAVELRNYNIIANCEQMNEPLISSFNCVTGKKLL